MSEYIILSIFLFLGAFIAAAATVVGLLLGYRTKNTKNKMAPYECGMDFPVMMNFREIMAGHTALSPAIVIADLAIFMAILVSGLAYAWKKGILKWE